MRGLFACKRVLLTFLVILNLPNVVAAQKLVAGYSAVSAISAPFWVMREAGFFKEEGLDAELIYISSSSTMA